MEHVARRPTKSEINKFINHIISDHSWYKHLHESQPSKFFVMLNPFEKNCERHGGLYYMTDLLCPPYGFIQSKDVVLPGNVTIPDMVWKELWVEFGDSSIYSKEGRAIFNNLVERVISAFVKNE